MDERTHCPICDIDLEMVERKMGDRYLLTKYICPKCKRETRTTDVVNKEKDDADPR